MGHLSHATVLRGFLRVLNNAGVKLSFANPKLVSRNPENVHLDRVRLWSTSISLKADLRGNRTKQDLPNHNDLRQLEIQGPEDQGEPVLAIVPKTVE